MRLARAALPALAVTAIVIGAALARAGDAASLHDRIRALLPKADEERWLRVPWRSDLAVGRFEANEQGKPVFLWLMDGDPLGCT